MIRDIKAWLDRLELQALQESLGVVVQLVHVENKEKLDRLDPLDHPDWMAKMEIQGETEKMAKTDNPVNQVNVAYQENEVQLDNRWETFLHNIWPCIGDINVSKLIHRYCSW